MRSTQKLSLRHSLRVKKRKQLMCFKMFIEFDLFIGTRGNVNGIVYNVYVYI